ncbi:glycosyltransferase family 25 protein [Nocardia sp. NPDC052566]|uniref:glycosyltransferase family 25 protein n=1 Tax=Nocardia sp. NPDC052566 TaxID=3364330 RepID=UPI0037C513BC
MIAADSISTYIVNLARRPDRRAWIDARIPTELAPIYTSDWDATFDGHELSLPHLHTAGFKLFDWQIDSDNPWWNRPLKYGEIGCTLAHLACWTHAADHTHTPYILILEDDADPAPEFLTTLLAGLDRLERNDVQFGLLYLGRYPLEPDQLSRVEGFVRPGYSHCSYAYLLPRAALATMLEADLSRAIVPIDEFLPALYIAHPRADLRARFPPALRAIAFDPPLATQRPKREAGSDTEDSDFVLL